jgi:hypothetical protein
MDIHQVRTEAIQEEIIAKMDAHQGRMEASMNATDAYTEEIESETEHQEVPKKEAAMEAFRALNWHLAIGHRQQLQKRTQDDDGSRKKLAAASRRMTRRAISSPRKGHGRRVPGRTVFQEKTLNDGRSRGDNGRAKNVAME